MVALMEPATNAEKVARGTLSATELDTRPQLDDHIVESSAYVLDGCMTPLELGQIAIQPRSHVVDTQVDQSVEIFYEFCHPLRVRDELSCRARAPGLQQSYEMHLDGFRWNWFSLGDSESCHCIIALQDEVCVKVLKIQSETGSHASS